MGKAETASRDKKTFLALRIAVRRWRNSGSFLLVLLAMCSSTAFGQQAHYRKHGEVLLNDLTVTPGLVRTTDKNDPAVCGGGSTKPYRKPGIQGVYKLYGATKKKGKCCEIDHLISLELGSDNGAANEWPQPYEPHPGAHEKDQVENWLHAQVCAGKMELKDAQRRIATDWYEVYLSAHPGKAVVRGKAAH